MFYLHIYKQSTDRGIEVFCMAVSFDPTSDPRVKRMQNGKQCYKVL